MTNLVEILVTAKNLTGPTMAAVNAEVNKAGKGMATFHKTAMLAGAGFALVGVEAVKMASKFDSDMTLLQTQASVSKDKIAGLKSGVLSLAGKVAQSPDSLAEALFHVESNFSSMGITSSKALALTETAAKGATVGHADLVDVTNALTAAVASGIPGVQNFDQAMGVLNATVGSGDMKMQDLANAFGSGMVATVKGFGLSITDVGAALATFGDNNIRGALAGNQLRMSVMALAKPIAGGEATLKSLGLEANTLAKDMQKGGLKLALEDLVAHMKAAGISSKEQGMIITEAFGRKAGAGLNVLVGQMDRLESKYPEITKGAKTFSQSWDDTKKTFAFQMKSMQTGFEALMISIGQKLIPPLQSFIGFLGEHKRAAIDSTEAMIGLLGAVVLVSAAMKAAAGAKIAWTGIKAGAAVAKTAMAGVAREAILMQAAFVTAGGGMRGLDAAFATMSTTAKTAGAVLLIAGLAIAAEHYSAAAKKAKIGSDEMASGLKNLAAGKGAGDVITQLTKDSGNLHQSFMQKLKSNDSVWDIVTNSGAKTSSAKKDYKQLGQTLTDMVKNGDAKQAAESLEKLNEAGVKVPTKDLKDYQSALAGVKLDSELTAQSQGRFGDEAQQVQTKLQAQQDVVDGLVNSLQALDQVNQDAYGSQTKFEDSISALSKGVKDNGKTLNIHSDAGRKNRDLLLAEAQATDDYTAKLDKQGASWDTIDGAYKRGYDQFVRNATAMDGNRSAAEKLAKSLLHLPPEFKVKGNISDFESQLKKAEADLKTAPKSKQVAIKGNIAQLKDAIRDAQSRVNSMTGKSIIIRATYSVVGGKGTEVFHEGGNYATGGHIMGPGSGTSDDVPIWASNGEFVVSSQATKRNRKLLEAINSGMPGFAKGGSVSSSEKSARSSAMGDLSQSYFGLAAGYKRNEFQSATASPGSVNDLAGTLNTWRNTIKAATHGAEESKLVASFDKFGKAALKNEAALTKVNSQLTSAKDKLATLKDSFNQLKDSVSSSVVSFGSIAKQSGAGPLGLNSPVNQLRSDVGQAQAFAAALEALRKKGLNGQSLSELAQAGIDGGGLTNAQALLNAKPGDIKTINALEKQLQAAGASAGGSAGTGLYGAQINSAQALVTGLEKQQSKLDKIMEHAADAMAKQLKRALGGKASGGTVGAAATGGNHWGRTLVGEYQPEIVDLPIGSRVHSGPDTQRMLSGGSGGNSQPLQINFILDGVVVARQLVDPFRSVIKGRGGNVQQVLGQRGK